MQNRVDAVIVTTLRFFAGLICFLPVFLRFEARKDVVLGGLEIGFWYALGFLAQGIALQSSSAAKASFVCALGVLVPPILDAAFPEAEGRSGELVAMWKQTNALRRFIPAILSCLGAGILEFGNVHEPLRSLEIPFYSCPPWPTPSLFGDARRSLANWDHGINLK